MNTQLIINSLFNETRIAVLEKSRLIELFIERKSNSSMVGNIYKGKVEKIVPGMQAAFVAMGDGRSGFLSAEDVYEESLSELFLEEEETKEGFQKKPPADTERAAPGSGSDGPGHKGTHRKQGSQAYLSRRHTGQVSCSASRVGLGEPVPQNNRQKKQEKIFRNHAEQARGHGFYSENGECGSGREGHQDRDESACEKMEKDKEKV